MKFIITIILLVSINSYGQQTILFNFPTDTATGEIIYRDIIKIDSVKKNELYNRAKQWVVYAFKDAKEVIQLDDSIHGKLVIKGTKQFYYEGTSNNITSSANAWLHYTISIYVKEGRYKYEISNISVKYPNFESPLDSYSTFDEKKHRKQCKDLGLSEKMTNETISDQKGNLTNIAVSCDKELRKIAEDIIEGMEKPYDTTDDGW